MPFIGNQPALSYTSFAKQDFTTSATTSYTLDQPVANENEIALFINFVRQEPTTAYTASGVNLNLTSATSASDDMYCVFLGKAVQTVNPPSGSVGISQLSATGTKDSTTFLRGDNTFATAGGTMTPAFQVYLNSAQAITSGVNTKVQFDTEVFDTDSAFDSSTNYRFTPQTAGKYFFYITILLDYNVSVGDRLRAIIYKNGSEHFKNTLNIRNSGAANGNLFLAGVIEMNGTTDYVEGYGMYDGGSSQFSSGSNNTFFGGYKIIE